jgi:hypothetical protein
MLENSKAYDPRLAKTVFSSALPNVQKLLENLWITFGDPITHTSGSVNHTLKWSLSTIFRSEKFTAKEVLKSFTHRNWAA